MWLDGDSAHPNGYRNPRAYRNPDPSADSDRHPHCGTIAHPNT
jgi:hypothetical protein